MMSSDALKHNRNSDVWVSYTVDLEATTKIMD